jgi:hypothetical protein
MINSVIQIINSRSRFVGLSNCKILDHRLFPSRIRRKAAHHCIKSKNFEYNKHAYTPLMRTTRKINALVYAFSWLFTTRSLLWMTEVDAGRWSNTLGNYWTEVSRDPNNGVASKYLGGTAAVWARAGAGDGSRRKPGRQKSHARLGPTAAQQSHHTHPYWRPYLLRRLCRFVIPRSPENLRNPAIPASSSISGPLTPRSSTLRRTSINSDLL